jgi:uncharacterized protein YcaQ
LVKRALKAMGIANEKEINKFLQPDAARDSDFRAVNRKMISQTLDDYVKEKIITTVQIEGKKGYINYILNETINDPTCIRNSEKKIHFLSPFDNLVIQRDRLKRLFDFDYTLECYVPAPKRIHGYFVHPILYGDQLVGRIDPKADRKTKKFILDNVSFEEGFKPDDEFLEKFSGKIFELAKFNHCNSISIESKKFPKLKSAIKSAIKKYQG